MIHNKVAVAHLVKYRYKVALAVCCSFGSLHSAYVSYDAVGANGIVVYKARDVLDKTVVANAYIT